MKVKIKFSVFFMIGLFVFVFYLGLMMSFLFEFVIPLFGIGYDDDLFNKNSFIFIFIIPFSFLNILKILSLLIIYTIFRILSTI